MSKKSEAFKEAIFYAHEKPELLANLLSDSIPDVATSISIFGDDSITIPQSGNTTAAYDAPVLSQFGDVMEGKATLSLNEAVTGVSISSGVVTVSSTVTAESFTLKAVAGSVTVTRTIQLVSGE